MALTDKLTNIADAIREKTGSTRTMNLEGMAAAVTNIKIPTALSDLNEDETHRTVTDAEKKTWNNKSNFSGNYDDLKNKQLAGTTDELTPTQVYEAVSTGRPVKVQYTDSTYGLISFTAFAVSESQNVIVSSMIVYYNGVYILTELVGYKSNNAWGFNTTTLAQKQDIPTKLPNPNALTFTGAVEGSYDGSAPLEVAIPNGGGSGFDEWECINTFTIPADTAEDVTSIIFSEDAEGKPFALKKFYAVFVGITGMGTYLCIRINDLLSTQQFGTSVINNNNIGKYNPLRAYFEIAGPCFYYWACPNVSSFGYRADGEITPNGGLQSNISQINKIRFNWGTEGAITPGTTVKLWGVRT